MHKKFTRCLKTPALILFIFLKILARDTQAQTLARHDEQFLSGANAGEFKTSDPTPVSLVNIMLKGANKANITPADGKLQIGNAKPGTYVLTATHVGLQAQEKEVTIITGQTSRVGLTLPRSSQQLNQVVVTESRSLNKRPVSVGNKPNNAAPICYNPGL